MGFAEDIAKLRLRVSDAVAKGLTVKDGKEFLESTLIQIMNEAERNRQNCMNNAETLRKQAAAFEGQAGAFASVSSIVFNVINGYVTLAEQEEQARLAEVEEEKAQPKDPDVARVIEEHKKTRKKKV